MSIAFRRHTDILEEIRLFYITIDHIQLLYTHTYTHTHRVRTQTMTVATSYGSTLTNNDDNESVNDGFDERSIYGDDDDNDTLISRKQSSLLSTNSNSNFTIIVQKPAFKYSILSIVMIVMLFFVTSRSGDDSFNTRNIDNISASSTGMHNSTRLM